MPIKASKAILSTLRKVKDESEKYHKERIKLLTDNAEKTDDGGPKMDEDNNFIIAEENQEKVNEALIQLMNKDVKLSKIKMADLGDAKVTAQELSLLEPIIS
jgi:hypothetical protein